MHVHLPTTTAQALFHTRPDLLATSNDTVLLEYAKFDQSSISFEATVRCCSLLPSPLISVRAQFSALIFRWEMQLLKLFRER